MNKQFIELYDAELTHLRHMAGDFAARNQTVAGRLSLSRDGICDDPHVERLLEGFAFMAARVQLKLQAEFPRFAQGLLETIQPHYLSPTPAMAIVQFEPDITNPALVEGPRIPRGTLLRSRKGDEDKTECKFQTAHDLRLWPIELVDARYMTRDLGVLDLPAEFRAKAALRLRFKSKTAAVPFSALALDRLPIYLKELGRDDLAARIYESIFRHGCGLLVQSSSRPVECYARLAATHVHPLGFADEEALLPYGPRTFQGYRLLREYFAFPQRFCFFELTGLSVAAARCVGPEMDVVIAFRERDEQLENRVGVKHFSLFCTPAVNSFPMELDRIWVTNRVHEFHVVPDRTRPLDFEVSEIQEVIGYGLRSEELQEFKPFYVVSDLEGTAGAYYTTHRVPRILTSEEQERGPLSSYTGSELYISLVDSEAPPHHRDLRQLGVRALCTNRHLPLRIPRGQGTTDFDMDLGVPCKAIRCLSGPTAPRPSFAEGEMAWRVISHLSLNYLTLTGDARALRDLLRLYADVLDSVAGAEAERRIAGLRTVETTPVLRALHTLRPAPISAGPMALARGLQVKLQFDEEPFEGVGVYLMGAVLNQFLARYASINSFVETIIHSRQRGELMRWPPRSGARNIL